MGVKDFTLGVKRPRGVDNTLSGITNCPNAIIKNTTDTEIYVRIVRVNLLQAKTYKFLPGQIRDDIIAEDYVSGKHEIERLASLGQLQIISVPWTVDCPPATPGGGVGNVEFTCTFAIVDWFSTDGGDTWSYDCNHGLMVAFPSIHVFEGDTEVYMHKVKVLNANAVRITVTQRSVDARFAGTIKLLG